MSRTQRLAFLLLSILVLTAACSKEKNAAAPAAGTSGAVATVGPLVTPQQLAAQPGGLETVRAALNLLLDQYYKPLKPNDLLQQAWSGVIQELQRQGGVDSGNAPKLTGDRAADFKAFSESFNKTATRGDPAAYANSAVTVMAKSLLDDHTFFITAAQYKAQQANLLGTSTLPIFSSAMLPGGIGYLRLTSFPTAYATLPDGKTLGEDLDAALATLSAQGAKGWLLDLRGNAGGSSDSIATLTGRFIPAGLVAVFVDGKGQHLELPVDGHYFPHQQPLAVLIDSRSSSAAELSASAFKEYGAARLFGQPTAGSVNGAEEFPLPGGAALEYTILQALSGKDLKPLDRVGVQPDQFVAIGADAGKDAQADAAEAWLESSAASTAAPAAAPTPAANGLSLAQISADLRPYGAKLADIPSSSSLRLLGEQTFDTPNEYAQYAPQALQLEQTVRARGWQGEFNQYFGNADPFTYQVTIDAYKDPAGAQQALQTNDLPQQYQNTALPAQIGDQTVAQKGIVSSAGQTRILWRRGRLVFTLLDVTEPGLESFGSLLQIARAMDARYEQNPFK